MQTHPLPSTEADLTQVGVCIARLGRAFGVRGWFKIWPLCEDLGLLKRRPLWLLEPGCRGLIRALHTEQLTLSPPRIKLSGIESRESAQELVNGQLWISKTQLPPPKADEYYFSELFGCEVVDAKGRYLGTVKEILETPAHEILVVSDEGRDPPSRVFIPFRFERFILKIDRTARKIWVDAERLLYS